MTDIDNGTTYQFCVGTHDGRFHADDVIAVALLFYLHSECETKLMRTRDPAILEKCSHVVDVGGQYDLASNRFDHHQVECNERFPGHDVPLSASGLVYRDLGRQIIDKMLVENQSDLKTTVDLERDMLIKQVYESVYSRFMKEIDAVDNGYLQYSKDDYETVRNAERYHRFTNVSSLLGSFNYHEYNSPRQIEQFGVAVQTAWNLIRRCILNQFRFVQSQMIETTALDILLRDREAIGANKHCLMLKSRYQTVDNYLRKNDPDGQIKFTISPRKAGEWGIYAVQKVPYTNLVDLISYEAVCELIKADVRYNIDDLIFIHKKRFIGSTKNIELAEQIVNWSVESAQQEQIVTAAIKHLSNSIDIESGDWSSHMDEYDDHKEKSTPTQMDIDETKSEQSIDHSVQESGHTDDKLTVVQPHPAVTDLPPVDVQEQSLPHNWRTLSGIGAAAAVAAILITAYVRRK